MGRFGRYGTTMAWRYGGRCARGSNAGPRFSSAKLRRHYLRGLSRICASTPRILEHVTNREFEEEVLIGDPLFGKWESPLKSQRSNWANPAKSKACAHIKSKR